MIRDLNLKPSVISEDFSGVLLELKKCCENIHKVAEDEPAKDEIDTEVEDDPLSDGGDIQKYDSESCRLLLQRCEELVEPLPSFYQSMFIKMTCGAVRDMRYFSFMVKERENQCLDMLKEEGKYWERACDSTVQRITEQNVHYSTVVDSVTALISDFMNKYVENLQIMAAELGSVVEWIKSTNEFFLQEIAKLRQLIADQETRICLLQSNLQIGGEMDVMRDFNGYNRAKSVQDLLFGTFPISNGELRVSQKSSVQQMFDKPICDNGGLGVAHSGVFANYDMVPVVVSSCVGSKHP